MPVAAGFAVVKGGGSADASTLAMALSLRVRGAMAFALNPPP
jgi:hypothetical protein